MKAKIWLSLLVLSALFLSAIRPVQAVAGLTACTNTEIATINTERKEVVDSRCGESFAFVRTIPGSVLVLASRKDGEWKSFLYARGDILIWFETLVKKGVDPSRVESDLGPGFVDFHPSPWIPPKCSREVQRLAIAKKAVTIVNYGILNKSTYLLIRTETDESLFRIGRDRKVVKVGIVSVDLSKATPVYHARESPEKPGLRD